MSLPDGIYLQWRQAAPALSQFRDSLRQGAPPERWLQEIWAHQRLQRDHLVTADGKPVRILHPGFRNRESGPDFLRAVVQIGDSAPASGDIEIDLRSSGWRSHGHFQNPAYGNVILHVVWEAPEAGATNLPTVALHEVLDAPSDELEAWVEGAAELPPESLAGQCSAPLRSLRPEDISELLCQAARVRLTAKGLAFRARGKSAGWKQALWEGVFRALGYKHNAWPMQRIAEILPSLPPLADDTRSHRDASEARILGLGGLLPSEPRRGSRARRLWDLWWRERDALKAQLLPPSLWRLNGVRPANHPQRRLALAASWYADDSWEKRLEAWFHQTVANPDADVEAELAEVLKPSADGFWRRHFTLSGRELPEAAPLIGSGRTNDLAVNIILPWFWARAHAGEDAATLRHVEALYLRWSPGEDNATLKLARARLFGSEDLPVRKTAALQQGLLQVVRDFCGHANSLCEACPFPRHLREFQTPS